MRPTHASNVLRAYRDLLILIKRLPKEKQQSAVSQARETLKKNKNEPNPVTASDMLRQLYGKVSFLRMTTPRAPGDGERFDQTSGGHYVLKDGELVEGYGRTKGGRVADGTVTMEEAHTIHNRLLRRQYYGKDPPKNPCGPF